MLKIAYIGLKHTKGYWKAALYRKTYRPWKNSEDNCNPLTASVLKRATGLDRTYNLQALSQAVKRQVRGDLISGVLHIHTQGFCHIGLNLKHILIVVGKRLLARLWLSKGLYPCFIFNIDLSLRDFMRTL